jgi:hypothetical protein
MKSRAPTLSRVGADVMSMSKSFTKDFMPRTRRSRRVILG